MTKIKEFKCIIFDLDGTLYEKNNQIIQVIDCKSEEFFRNYGVHDMKKLEKKFPNFLLALEYLMVERKIYVEHVYCNISYDAYIKKNEYLIEVLKKIKKLKKKILIVSLAPSKHIINVLHQLEIEDYIDAFFSICDEKHWNKKDDAYQYICEYYKLKSKEILCVGDSLENDIKPAEKLGFITYNV